MAFCLEATAQITLTGTRDVLVESTGNHHPTRTRTTYASDDLTVAYTSSSSDGLFTGLVSTMVNQNIATSSQIRTLPVGDDHSSDNIFTVTGTSGPTSRIISSSASPTSTQSCNSYPQFCNRKYSNITQVAAHNSPFIQQNNAARNQMLPVEDQLNDGIRMLQFQTHLVNGTMFLCHTSCDILNAGTLEAYLTRIAKWLRANPYNVLTILISNQNFVEPGQFLEPFESSGLYDYVYEPPKVGMALEDWPTLWSMIGHHKQVVVMLDYMANQMKYPWLLDEFSQM